MITNFLSQPGQLGQSGQSGQSGQTQKWWDLVRTLKRIADSQVPFLLIFQPSLYSHVSTLISLITCCLMVASYQFTFQWRHNEINYMWYSCTNVAPYVHITHIRYTISDNLYCHDLALNTNCAISGSLGQFGTLPCTSLIFISNRCSTFPKP